MILSKVKRLPRLNYQQSRGKAIQHWKRPSMDEMPSPTIRFEKAFAMNQTRNNTQLAFGVGSLIGVLWWTQLHDLLPVSKRYEKVIKSLEPYRRQVNNFIAEEQHTLPVPSLSVQYVNHEVKNNEEDEDSKVSDASVRKSPGGIPETVTYLIIGGGTASFGAYRSIKATDPTAKILIISEEKGTPYMRPPLTKELWYFEKNHKSEGELTFKSFSGRERNLYFEKEAFYTPVDSIEFNDKGGIGVLKGVKVTQLIPDEKTVKLDDGRQIKYEKCLLATGGRPRVPKIFEHFKDDPRVTTFRNVQDFHHLETRVKSGQVKSIVIVGGGFLGTELASSLGIFSKDTKDIDLSISQILPEKGHLAKVLPPYLSKWATKTLIKDGVQVHTESNVTSAQSTADNNQIELRLNNNEDVIKADHVILAVGIDPATELAADAGLPIDPVYGGFEVNEELQAVRDVYVAGDAASFVHSQHGRIRHEHHDNALVTGKIAGLNMTGEHKTVNVNPLFWSDLGNDVGLEGTGRIDSSLETVGVYAKTNQNDDYVKGVVFYKDDQDVVVGVLMWNVFNKMATARRIVNERRKYEDLMEVAKLFDLYRKSEAELEAEQT